jgi:hypothetical protein
VEKIKIPDFLQKLLFAAMLQAFEQQISAMDLTKSGSKLAEGRVFPGGKMFELMKAAKIQRHHRDRINSLIDRIHMFLTKNRMALNLYFISLKFFFSGQTRTLGHQRHCLETICNAHFSRFR